jgi:hypothetical protein
LKVRVLYALPQGIAVDLAQSSFYFKLAGFTKYLRIVTTGLTLLVTALINWPILQLPNTLQIGISGLFSPQISSGMNSAYSVNRNINTRGEHYESRFSRQCNRSPVQFFHPGTGTVTAGPLVIGGIYVCHVSGVVDHIARMDYPLMVDH